ncbi:putative ABC transporter permease [Acutalibacter intestini]|uniref:putative ABC transporter permease n=1 Tax=Acutalibacter intestini TaxID=3093659 RepID=UPI002AC9C1B5|nr:putative ABC transporter permease [Acutalibacter sp. M00204]
MAYTYLWCFFIYAFLGWCGEVLYAAAIERRFVNRGFLSGPVCPIYGLGVVLISYVMRPFGGNLAALMLGSIVLGSALEWLAGYLLEKIFRQKWWDYSDEPHNLNGYICLKFSMLWGVAGAIVVRFVTPATGRMVSHIPLTVGWVILAVLLALLTADLAVTVVSIIGLNCKLRMLEYVSARLKEGSDKLGESLFQHASATQGATAAISKRTAKWQLDPEHLREKYEQYLRSNILHRRLLKAFPNLRSLRHNEQLTALQESIDVFRRKSKDAQRRRNEAAIAAYEDHLPEGAEKPFAYKICYEKLFWIFMAGNVVGCVLETIYALIVPPHQFELRVSVVIGPFILVYGFGAVAITLFLRRMYNQRDVLIFFASMVIGASFEYFCSFVQQAAFGTVSWEYSDSFLNLGGRTNLMYSFFWGILGMVWVKDLYPVVSRSLEKIPKKLGRGLTIFFTIFMVADMALSAAAVLRQQARAQGRPAGNPVEIMLDRIFSDDVMELIYPHMQYVGKPKPPEEVFKEKNLLFEVPGNHPALAAQKSQEFFGSLELEFLP